MNRARVLGWMDVSRFRRPDPKPTAATKRRLLDALLFDPRDTVADAALRRRLRLREKLDPRYLAYVREHPCLVGRGCSGVVQAHHEPPKSNAGQWHDRLTVPLCQLHHQGFGGRHYGLGSLELFEAAHEVCIAEAIAKLNAAYEEEAGF